MNYEKKKTTGWLFPDNSPDEAEAVFLGVETGKSKKGNEYHYFVLGNGKGLPFDENQVTDFNIDLTAMAQKYGANTDAWINKSFKLLKQDSKWIAVLEA